MAHRAEALGQHADPEFKRAATQRVKNRIAAVAFALAMLVFAAGIYLSVRHGVPHDARGRETVPDYALDWALLLHLERGAALLAAITVPTLVVWWGVHGRWPSTFLGLGYEPPEVRAAADHVVVVEPLRERAGSRILDGEVATGVVVAVGANPTEIEEGDIVEYAKPGIAEVDVADKTYVILNEDVILNEADLFSVDEAECDAPGGPSMHDLRGLRETVRQLREAGDSAMAPPGLGDS